MSDKAGSEEIVCSDSGSASVKDSSFVPRHVDGETAKVAGEDAEVLQRGTTCEEPASEKLTAPNAEPSGATDNGNVNENLVSAVSVTDGITYANTDISPTLEKASDAKLSASLDTNSEAVDGVHGADAVVSPPTNPQLDTVGPSDKGVAQSFQVSGIPSQVAVNHSPASASPSGISSHFSESASPSVTISENADTSVVNKSQESLEDSLPQDKADPGLKVEIPSLDPQVTSRSQFSDGEIAAKETVVTREADAAEKPQLDADSKISAEMKTGATDVDSASGTDQVAAKQLKASSSADSDDEKQSIYHVKWIKHKGASMPIITQNENGPCPLLAIINLLLLQSKIKLPSQSEIVTSNELLAHLADWIFEHVPKNISEDTRLNYEQNMHDAIAVFPRLQTGLDVNVRFTGVSEFEYTPECIVFDLLDLPLYHGWLVDPQMPDLVSAVGNRTYNQLVEKIILQKNSDQEDLVAEALQADEFLSTTASQLTYHGLSELSATIKEEEMCVFFRNNHFSTLYKHKNELFVLVTDQGLLREPNVVWETLSNIEGDGHFVDADFRTYRIPDASAQPPLPAASFAVNSKEQIDHDYLVALSLEQEQSELQAAPLWSDPAAATLSDHELALRLQEEENMNAEAANQQPTQRQPKPVAAPAPAASSGSGGGSGTKEKKDSNCSLM